MQSDDFHRGWAAAHLALNVRTQALDKAIAMRGSADPKDVLRIARQFEDYLTAAPVDTVESV